MTEYASPARSARPSWREEQRRDRTADAEIRREDDTARARLAIERDRAWAEERRLARADRDKRAAEHRRERAEARTRGLAAARDHAVDLLMVPVIGVPALLAWPAMAIWGAGIWVPLGVILPALSEGGMWAFAAALALRRRKDPDAPVWGLQLGIWVFAGFGAVLNFLHGMAPGTPHRGPAVALTMALVSLAGLCAHQLLFAGARRPRAERYRARLERTVARREHAARMASAFRARVSLDEHGGARQVYRPGTATLKHGLCRPRLADFQDPPTPDAVPGQDPAPAGDHVRKDEAAANPVREEPTETRTHTDDSQTGGRTDEADPDTGETRTEPDPARRTGREGTGIPARTGSTGPQAETGSLAARTRSEVVELIAAQISGADRAGKPWRPDYGALMADTGRGRSWCEKAVRDARRLAAPSGGDHGGEGTPRTGSRTGTRTRTDHAEPGGAQAPTGDGNPDSARTDGPVLTAVS